MPIFKLKNNINSGQYRLGYIFVLSAKLRYGCPCLPITIIIITFHLSFMRALLRNQKKCSRLLIHENGWFAPCLIVDDVWKKTNIENPNKSTWQVDTHRPLFTLRRLKRDYFYSCGMILACLEESLSRKSIIMSHIESLTLVLNSRAKIVTT